MLCYVIMPLVSLIFGLIDTEGFTELLFIMQVVKGAGSNFKSEILKYDHSN